MVGAAGLVKIFEDLMRAKQAKSRKYLTLLAIVALTGFAGTAMAGPDDAPTPRKMPRVPVAKQQLATNSKPTIAPGKVVEGQAAILDTERLRIGDVEVRLFGVVPPQLSAFYGPQARAALDTMAAAGAVSCVVRDRDRDGRLLATCHDAAKQDMAETLLRRGLAVTARGSLRPTDLATPYMTAEQAAQSQKTGLWSVNVPPEVKVVPAPAADVVKDNDSKAKDGMLASLLASATNLNSSDKKPEDEKAELAKAEAAKTENTPASVNTPSIPAADAAPSVVSAADIPVIDATIGTAPTGFVERYQLLITGLVMLLTALSVIVAVSVNRWWDKREEIRSIAAALRGELQAARAVCIARLQNYVNESDDRAIAWPRIRVLVFQAYVGRIGQLGADLARQIASIYGQASDYAAYYAASNGTDAKFEPVSKRQSLQTLVRHIEEVLPRLAHVEQTGHGTGRVIRLTHNKAQGLPTPPRPGTTLPLQARSVQSTETTAMPKAITHEPQVAEQQEETVYRAPAEPVADKNVVTEAAVAAAADMTAKPVAAVTPGKTASESSTPPLWGVIRRFAADRLERSKKEMAMEELIPDYAAMSDEEIEALAYAEGLNESDVIEATSLNYKSRHTG